MAPAFQEQKACLASSWNRLGVDGTLQCAHHVETGLAGGQMVYGTLGVCPLSPQEGRLLAVCFRDGQGRLSPDRSVAEGTEGKEKTSRMKPYFL